MYSPKFSIGRVSPRGPTISRVSSRTDHFFAKTLGTLADVDDKVLSVFLHRKVTAWYLLFPPVHSPDRMDDTKRFLKRIKRDPRGRAQVIVNVDEETASSPILSEADDTSDDKA